MSLKTIIVVACVSVVTIGFFGCADLPNDAPEFPDFRTMARFINAATDIGQAQIVVRTKIDLQTVTNAQGEEEEINVAPFDPFATLDLQASSNYADFPAGNREAALVVGGVNVDTTLLSFDSDGKLTVLVLPKDQPTDARFQVYRERRTFDTLPDTVGQVRFISAGTGGVSYDIVDASDTTVVASGLSLAGSSGYQNFQAGSFTFGVVVSGTQTILSTADVSLSNGQRYTAVIFGPQASLALKAFQDD